MPRVRSLVLAATIAASSLFAFFPAASDPIVCHEFSCCEDVVILGKTIIHIDC